MTPERKKKLEAAGWKFGNAEDFLNNMDQQIVWTNVNDALPTKSGWYLVYAPTYTGGSSSGLENIEGVMFSKFNIYKNGNKNWSIEVGYHKRPGCVQFWMPIPKPI